MSAGSKKVLVLSYRSDGEERFIEAIKKSKPKLDITFSSYLNIQLHVQAGKPLIKLSAEGLDIASFDLVYFKSFSRHGDLASAMANYLSKRQVKFVDSATKYNRISSKIYQYVLLGDNGVSVPDSLFVPITTLKSSFDLFKESLGVPFILKDIHGYKGKLNFLIHSSTDFDKAAAEAKGTAVELIGQRYVNNDGDYRLLVFGNKIYLSIKRSRSNDLTHLNNLSQGGSFIQARLSDLPDSVQAQALKAAEVLERQVAGVDMVKDSITDRWYCLEVNEGPQISSGVLLSEKQQAVGEFFEDYLSYS